MNSIYSVRLAADISATVTMSLACDLPFCTKAFHRKSYLKTKYPYNFKNQYIVYKHCANANIPQYIVLLRHYDIFLFRKKDSRMGAPDITSYPTPLN